MSKTTLIGAAVASLLATSAFADGHLTKIKYGTNWVAQAEHGGYYQALADGTYEACGLDVEIIPGGPQVVNRNLMYAGKIDFYMGGNMLFAFDAVKEKIPAKVVAAHFQKEPQVLMSHPGKVSSFEELADLGTHIVGDGGFISYYQWLMTDFGFDSEKRVPYTFNPGPFIINEDSFQQGYITSEPLAVEKEGGFKPDLWLLADYGFATYATTIEAMQQTIDEKPEAVKCFVEASSIGWANYLYGDNAAANELIKADNPDMSDEKLAFSIEKMKEFGIVDSGIALEKGIGAMDPAQIESFFNTMVKAGVVDADVDWKSSFTTEFSNTGVALEAKKAAMGQ
ncbi:MAG: ABC transporter substrate-binding protein [Silicimonas sp.]|nr:ABC transporter substrate-binding protein [Silicimonas sp.]